MDYRITALNSGDAIEMPLEDWVMLMSLAGLASHRFQPPEVIPPPEAREIAQALKKAVPSLSEETRDILATDALGTATPESGWHPKNAPGHFGGERRAHVEEFIELCEQGALEVRKLA